MAKKKVNCKEFADAMLLFLLVTGMPSDPATNQLNDKNPTDDNHNDFSEGKGHSSPNLDSSEDQKPEEDSNSESESDGERGDPPMRKLLLS